MKRRRPGLQNKWAYVVNSLQEIIPSYEVASSRISLFADKGLRLDAASFAAEKGALVLDLGAGPGAMSRLVVARGGVPVLLDASRAMLKTSSFAHKVQATFEKLPFRDGVFDGVVSGFALRDSRDLVAAISQVARSLKKGGRFAFCDLGKPDSAVLALAIGSYLRVAPNLIGLVTAGRSGLRYGSLYDTYVLAPHNSELAAILARFFTQVSLRKSQGGGSIVAMCVR